jgi:hypothetical protein
LRGQGIDYVEMNVSMAVLGANNLAMANINGRRSPNRALRRYNNRYK